LKVKVSAPGKSILMGEHAAVYGRPALVAAVDRRLTVEMTAVAGFSGIQLNLPQLGVDQKVPWPELIDYSRAAKLRWEAYRRDPDPSIFTSVRGTDPAHVVKVALGEAAQFLKEDGGPSIILRISSQIPQGAGFGSSAAAAVAIQHAYFCLRGAKVGRRALHHTSLEVERRQHGLPSGVDNAAVIQGGLLKTRRQESGALRVESLHTRSAVLEKVRVYNSGTPNEATGAVVAAVRRLGESNQEAFQERLDRMAAATAELRLELEGPSENGQRVIRLMRIFEQELEALGVVPAAVRRLVRQVEEKGGAAKISGAGALTGSGAGSLLVYHPSARVESWPFLKPLERLDLRLGAEGLRREVV